MTDRTNAKLEFGLFNHIEKSSGNPALDVLYDEHIEFIQQAEQAGFWGYHLAEHHATPLSMVPSPSLFLAALARQTKRIRLGPLVYLLPFYNPLRLIYEICMLDNLSGGRLEIGVGRGINVYEHQFYRINTLEAREIFEEALEVLIKGLTHDRLKHRGIHFRFDDVPLMDLRPLQQPYPGLWYGALNNNSIVFAARRGMNVGTGGPLPALKRAIELYWETRKQYSNSPDNLQPHVADPRIGPLRFLYVDDDERRGDALARAAYDVYERNINKLVNDYGLNDNRVTIPYDVMRTGGAMIVGSPSRVHDEIAHQLAEARFNYILLNMKFGSLQAAESLRSLELFAGKVMPELIKRG
jgi:alkanesulfonate monooxygenase SsuD/methylene tetrahydromethanopterin reductase-like flavin-dependent oxidoreductase (luciferase family)